MRQPRGSRPRKRELDALNELAATPAGQAAKPLLSSLDRSTCPALEWLLEDG